MPIQGVFEAIDHHHGVGWFIKGWAFDPTAPNTPVQLVLYTQDKAIQHFVANRERADLVAAKIGSGRHAFELQLPESLLDGRPFNLQVLVASEQSWLPKSAAEWFSASVVAGSLEHIEQGQLSGWAASNTPGRPPVVDVSIDDEWITSLTCDIARPDLRPAIAGHNAAGFRYNIPRRYHDGKPHSVAVSVANHPAQLEGSPQTFSLRAGLETTRQRVLRAELQALQDKVRSYEDLLAREPGNRIADPAAYAEWLPQHEQRLQQYAKRSRSKAKLPTVVLKPIDANKGKALAAWLRRSKADAVCFVGRHDAVHPLWLQLAAQALRSKHSLAVYCDEDQRSNKPRAAAAVQAPFFKPDWDPERFRAQNYLGLACAVRTKALLHALQQLPTQANDWPASRWVAGLLDLALLPLSNKKKSKQVMHLPWVLYHRGTPWQPLLPGKQRAALVAQALHAMGKQATVAVHRKHLLHIRYALPNPPPEVVLLIPTRDRLDLLRTCIESIQRLTDYPNYRIVVIDNDSCEAATLEYLQALATTPKVQVRRWPGAFNYSAMHNDVIAELQAPYVALVNNDIEALHPSWLTEMMMLAQRPDTGAVGAKLLYPNGLVQHGGVIVGMHGVADNAQRSFGSDEDGYFESLQVVQQFSAVTAACMVLRRSDYLAVGGMDVKHLPIAFNDVDLCLKLGEAGKRNLWTPHATLHHHESATRGQSLFFSQQQLKETEERNLDGKWDIQNLQDPYYNPNLSLSDQSHVDFRRVRKLLS